LTWIIVAALLAVGMALLFAEVAIIPGFGVAGISAIVCLAGGVGLAWYQYGPTWGVGSLLIAGALTLAMIVIAPRTRAGRDLVLKTASTGDHTGDEGYAGLVDQVGVALTPLRPAGAVDIGGRRVDVVTDGQFIDAGTAVRVVVVEGSRVVVVADPGGTTS